ncbi:MAG: LysM peptidoglycan-binding domain-containing protein [Kofleriaceae bacterium]
MRVALAGFAGVLLGAATGLVGPGQAAAEAVAPGVQAVPPTVAPALDLPDDPGGRRAVRGCPVSSTCKGPAELVEFELAAFPPPEASPWLDGGDRPGAMPGEPVRVERVAKPSQLRPELAWLDDLVMPDLPVTWTRRLIDYLLFYKDDPRGRNIMRGWLENQGRYRDLILAELRRARLPEDLLYVAMIESSYDPHDSSYAGAAGLWQFMPAGGRIYGMQIDRWLDERSDPLRATVAVTSYFADLYQRFADWPLALAAFNAGYGAVLRSIARYNTNDYYQLGSYENGLAWESTLYVPKAIACAIVGHNRKAFGFDDVTPKAAERWEEVAVKTSTSLSTIAKAAGVGVDAIKRLNPHLRRGRTPPGRADYVVRIPVGSKADFPRRLADLRSEWDGYDAYVVAQGERVEDIATTFGLSLRKLKALNEIEHESEVAGGTVLVVPKVDEATRARNRAKAQADLHASGVDQVEGEPLIVAVPDKDADVAGARRVFYRVVTGDSLWRVGRALGVAPKDLAAWNALAADASLHPKMVLQAWVDPAAALDGVQLLDERLVVVVTRGSAEHLDLAEARTGRVRVEYVAKKKESFEQIGKKYGLGPRDLARINRRPSTTVLEPGESIIVYQAVDRGRSSRADEQWRKSAKGQRGTPSEAPPTRVAVDPGSVPVTAPSDAPAAGGAQPVASPD